MLKNAIYYKMITKVKDWLRQKENGTQFEVLSRNKITSEIDSIKRIKDDAFFRREGSYIVDISIIDDYIDACFNPTLFNEDLIHIEYYIIFSKKDGNIEILNGTTEANGIEFSKDGNKIMYINSKSEKRQIYTQVDSYEIPKN